MKKERIVFIGSMALFAAIFSGCSKSNSSNNGTGSGTLSATWTSPVSGSTVQTATGVNLKATVSSPAFPVAVAVQVVPATTPAAMFSHVPATVHVWSPGSSGVLSYTLQSSSPDLNETVLLDSTIAAGTYTLNATMTDASGNGKLITTTISVQNTNDVVAPVLKDTSGTLTVLASGTFTLHVTLTDNKRLGSLEMNMINNSTKISTSVLGQGAGVNVLDLTTSGHQGITYSDKISLANLNLTAGAYTLQIIGRDAVNNYVEHDYTVNVQ